MRAEEWHGQLGRARWQLAAEVRLVEELTHARARVLPKMK
jgi:hypothetical protein